jgi:hypothetical protein
MLVTKPHSLVPDRINDSKYYQFLSPNVEVQRSTSQGVFFIERFFFFPSPAKFEIWYFPVSKLQLLWLIPS